jgi:NIMA (never in mitosis gene a)-related kinase
VKTQNIFLTKNKKIKLGDFGISKTLENTLDFAKTSLGTPYFLSPEICSGNNYNNKSDVWMLGCVIFELCNLKKPFEGKNFPDLIKNIITTKHPNLNEIYSDDIRKLVDSLLEKSPENRPTISELLTSDYLLPRKQAFEKKLQQKTFSKANLIINTEEDNNLFAGIPEQSLLVSPTQIEEMTTLINNLSKPPQTKKYSNKSVTIYKSSDISQVYTRDDYPRTPTEGPPIGNLFQDKSNLTPSSFVKKCSEVKSKFSQDASPKPSFSKQKGPISISISSTQSPVNKAVYLTEDITLKKKSSFNSLSNTHTEKRKFSDVLNSSSSSHSPSLMIDFLKNKIGEEKFQAIVNVLDKQDKPLEFLNSQGMRDICGGNYNQAANILKYVYSSNISPNSNTSNSTKSSGFYL